MFILKIETDNSAFEGRDFAEEIARILRVTAEKLEGGRHGGNCVDINGNLVGSFDVVEEEE